MENVVFTQLSIPELKQLFRQELDSYFAVSAKQIQPDTEEILTIKQAAELLKLAVPTIYSLVSKAEIPVNKQGKRLYFSKVELLEWIKSGRKKTHAEIEAEAQAYINHKR